MAVRIVRLLVVELRVLREYVAEFESAIASAFARHPEKIFSVNCRSRSGVGPRLLVAFGTLRDRYANAAAMQRYFGVAPVTERSGGRAWVYWRWNAPVFVRQALVEWAGQTVVYCPWAKAYYEQQRVKRVGHWAILRALAFKWLRNLWHCWQKSEAYD